MLLLKCTSIAITLVLFNNEYIFIFNFLKGHHLGMECCLIILKGSSIQDGVPVLNVISALETAYYHMAIWAPDLHTTYARNWHLDRTTWLCCCRPSSGRGRIPACCSLGSTGIAIPCPVRNCFVPAVRCVGRAGQRAARHSSRYSGLDQQHTTNNINYHLTISSSSVVT